MDMLDLAPFAVEIVAYGIAEAFVGEIMGGMGRHRHIAARELVFSLCACLDNAKFVLNGKINGLMIADLKMQEGVVFDTSPMSPEKRVAADKIDRSRDIAPAALCHDQQNIVGHALPDQLEEFPVQIGTPPFAASRIHIEGKEIIPYGFGQIVAGQPVDFDSLCMCFAPLFP